MLSTLPFVELDFNNSIQKKIYDTIIDATHNIYDITDKLSSPQPKRVRSVLLSQKDLLIERIHGLIEKVYKLDF